MLSSDSSTANTGAAKSSTTSTPSSMMTSVLKAQTVSEPSHVANCYSPELLATPMAATASTKPKRTKIITPDTSDVSTKHQTTISSKSSAVTSQYTPVHDEEYFPTLATATTLTAAASSKPKRTESADSIDKSIAIDIDASEIPTEYHGCHPDISTKHGEYKSAFFKSWNFPATLKNLKDGGPIDLRSIEKASAEAYQNPSKFDPEQVAEFTQLVSDKKLDINPAYWGDMHGSCKRAKEQEAYIIIDQLKEHFKKIQQYKKGEVASLEGYGRSNGSGSSSPIADYGIGPKFENNIVGAYQQMIAKAFEITERKERYEDTLSIDHSEEEALSFDKK